MAETTDVELMKKIARGDSRAFRELFERHSGKVVGYATRLMGGDAVKAEDISQSAWIKIVKAAPSYEPRADFSAWLFTIVRNTAFNELRSVKREATTEFVEEACAEEALSRESIEEQLIQKNRVEKIQKEMDQLPAQQRLALTVWLTEDVSYDDLAVLLGVSVSSVKSLLFRARKNLEMALVKDGAKS